MENKLKIVALELLKDLEKNPIVVNQGTVRKFDEFDKERIKTLVEVKEKLISFFNNGLSLENMKTEIDSINKRKPLWGFRGINGQMFFNMLYKSSNNKSDLAKILKDVLEVPSNIKSAKEKINKLELFIKTDVDEGDKRKVPRTKSILYFLSYFWQIQEPEKYPIFYNSTEQVFTELGFLVHKEDLAEYYQDFYNLNMELLELFKGQHTGTNLWFIEHVFWKYFIEKMDVSEETTQKREKVGKKEIVESSRDFIPKILSDLSSLSLNEANPADFEKKTGILFTMLGFETEIKGQGQGRTVDIIARANTSKPYILLIDCKARSKEDFRFVAGDERKSIEHIKNFNHDYPRESKYEAYYLIVSSGFRNGDEDVMRKIKGETSVDVRQITSEALLFLLEKRLLMWDLDLEIMREIFQRDSMITKDIIQDVLGR